MTARYANHVLLNTGQEELYLDFSSGIVTDRSVGVSVMPIHTRIAMTPSGVVRLWQLLGQAVKNFQVIQTAPQQPAAPTPSRAASRRNSRRPGIIPFAAGPASHEQSGFANLQRCGQARREPA